MTASGWCVHGVPYGPMWRCALCSGSNSTSFSTETPRVDPWTREDVLKVIRLLESIEYSLRRMAR